MKLISICVKKNIEVKKSYTKSCPSFCQGLELRAVADMQLLKRDEQLKPLTVQSLRELGDLRFFERASSLHLHF